MQTIQPAASQQQERLARRAKQANDRVKGKATPEPVPYQIMAPYVPTGSDYADQRYFSRGTSNRSLELKSAKTSDDLRGKWIYSSAAVEVYRNADEDTAELITKVRIGGNRCESTVTGTADELREIAYRLLDAAHDLEAFPASVLSQVAA